MAVRVWLSEAEYAFLLRMVLADDCPDGVTSMVLESVGRRREGRWPLRLEPAALAHLAHYLAAAGAGHHQGEALAARLAAHAPEDVSHA